jgi:uncharacterized membrane protein YhaH (DUF805 family)
MDVSDNLEAEATGPVAFARFSVKLGLGLSVTALVWACPFLFVPRGHDIRPMGWPLVLCMVAGIGLLLGVPCGVAGLFSKCWRRALLGILLCLSPLPVGIGIAHIVAFINGFTFAP